VVRRVPRLKAAVVRPEGSIREFAQGVSGQPGIAYVERQIPRAPAVDPSLALGPYPGASFEWQYAAAHENDVPASVLRAASAVTIAVVDTGADLSAPDLAAKAPLTHSVITGGADVTDLAGHGTFVASLAAGSVTNDDGIAGFGGDARLMVVQAGDADGDFSDVDEAAGIVYAVDHGARIVNLSLGGEGTSSIEASAVRYAANRGVLLVAAAGNSYLYGNPVMYPAALLQPNGSNGRGGVGLAVAGSDWNGARAPFSSTGSFVSLAAPGVDVFGAVASRASSAMWPRSLLPDSSAGQYGYASGTSFSSPEVAGAAALVWAANPGLLAGQVASILKSTASGHGRWTSQLGYGVIDVAAAVARAQHVAGRRPGAKRAILPAARATTTLRDRVRSRR
jgi:subtilisin family serine protease